MTHNDSLPGTHLPKHAGAGSEQVSSHGFPQSDQINGFGQTLLQLLFALFFNVLDKSSLV